MNAWYAILVALLLGSCALTKPEAEAPNDQSAQADNPSQAADSTRPVTTIAQARVLWKQSQIKSYNFSQQRHCFCRREYTRPIAVVVKDGSIISATYEDSGLPVSNGVRKTVRTIGDWLDYIATRQLNDPYEFEAIFHPQHGYPIRYNVDQREGVADDTEEVMFRSFSALP